LATLALRHAADEIRHGVSPGVAATHGYAISFRVGAVLLAVSSVLALLLLERISAPLRSELVTE
jgi:hypothetical protein